MIPDPSPPFEFEPSREIREPVRTLVDRATEQGLRDEAIEAFARIYYLLTMKPRKWGDPVRRYRNAQLTEYRGFHWDLMCRYAVHDRVPIVFLIEITPLEESPLYGT
jgi:hypothetical protein